ncbi:hypothetical protein [Roseobacter sp. HKCCD5988]|uniref:hypothetical protein n=1 Tax=Roseobacter sp. HKCCD5988 TaxID=3120338 RepID=UPI0030ECF76C
MEAYHRKINLVTCFFKPSNSSSNSDINQIISGPQQADLLARSFQNFSSLGTAFFISNEHSDSPFLRNINVPDPDVNKLTLEVIRKFNFFFSKYEFEDPHFVVCDPDFLLISPGVEAVFDGSFDIGVTLRPDKRMPYNSGIFFVDNSRINAGKIFYQLQEDLINEKHMDHASWFCDQLVISDLLDSKSEYIGGGLYKVNDLIIKVFDAKKYNFSPNRDHPNLFSVPSGVVLYHFKGRCRTSMKLFFKYFVEDNSSSRFKIFRYIMQALYAEFLRKKYKRLFVMAKDRIMPSDRKI